MSNKSKGKFVFLKVSIDIQFIPSDGNIVDDGGYLILGWRKCLYLDSTRYN